MVKIVVISLVCATLTVYLKSINSDFWTLSLIASEVIVFLCVITYISEYFSLFKELLGLIDIDLNLFKIVIKCISIGYLVEFGSGIIEDLGLKSLSDKLVFAGKILIICSALPIFYTIIKMITELI